MAQKNILQYILLGLLAQNDMAGYDIKKLFDTEISDFWHANHSQIYPELRRLEAEGYIEATTEIVGEKLEKHRYHITEKGYPLLNQWMSDSLGKIPPSKDEFPIKAYFISDATDPVMTALINEEIERHATLLAYLEGRMDTVCPKGIIEHYGHALILRRAIHREKAFLSWLEEEKQLLKEQLHK